jgi:hypothetical protein
LIASQQLKNEKKNLYELFLQNNMGQYINEIYKISFLISFMELKKINTVNYYFNADINVKKKPENL